MYWEISGAVLLWAVGTIAIGEWFALQKLNMKYTQLESLHAKLMSDHARLIREYSGQE
jgi:hypothetical protein